MRSSTGMGTLWASSGLDQTMAIQPFKCRSCGEVGAPVEGVEVEHVDLSDLRRFVGCDSCGARHEVAITDLPEGRFFEVVRVFPEDQVAS